MIHVAIMCATGRRAITGPRCPAYEDTVPLDDVHRWYAATLAEHAWTVDEDGNTYCPVHNPADKGAIVSLREGEYRALGDTGWEARLPGDYTGSVDIEIRQKRGGGHG